LTGIKVVLHAVAQSVTGMPARFLKVIACEIAFREICHVAAQSRT
jgi:hypothetical protein